MNVSKNKVVSVLYTLRTQQGGEIVEQTPEDKPLTFLFGRGAMLEKFEQNLENLSQGDKFEFHLTSQEAYGEYNKELVVDIPRTVFETNGQIDTKFVYVGAVIPMQDNHGNHMMGTIKEIGETSIKMDFNHQMAGKDLYFEGSIKEIREASEEEIEHGHVHHEGKCCGHGDGHCHKDGEKGHCCHDEGEHHGHCHKENGEHHGHCHKDGEHHGNHNGN